MGSLRHLDGLQVPEHDHLLALLIHGSTAHHLYNTSALGQSCDSACADLLYERVHTSGCGEALRMDEWQSTDESLLVAGEKFPSGGHC